MLLTLTITPSNTKIQGCSQCHCQKLKLGRNLTEYEEAYVEKWVMDYNYDF